MLAAQGLVNIRTLQDLDGRDRVVCAEKSQDGDMCGSSRFRAESRKICLSERAPL